MSGEVLDLSKRNFRVAFTIESYFSPYNQKSNPEYVKYVFRLLGKRNGKEYERILPYHNCSDADYAQFYPVKTASAGLLEAIKADPARGMFCLDWNSEDGPIEITGGHTDDDYTRFEVTLHPCNY